MYPSQRKFSAALGEQGIKVGQSHISAIERGERQPSADLLAAFVEALETNFDYLFGLTDDPRPPSDLEDQVVLGMKDPELRAVMQEIADILRELPPERLELVREWLRMIVPRKPRIIGGE